MNDKIFLDTNIYLYLFDRDHPAKQQKAALIVEESLKNRKNFIISFQVVQEFLNVALKKNVMNFTPEECLKFAQTAMIPNCLIAPSFDLYVSAVAACAKRSLSFYDALIVAAAQEAGCSRVYTEDMQPGRFDKHLQIVNPFTVHS